MPSNRWYSAVGIRSASSSPSCGGACTSSANDDHVDRDPHRRQPVALVVGRSEASHCGDQRAFVLAGLHPLQHQRLEPRPQLAVTERARRVQHRGVVGDAHHPLERSALRGGTRSRPPGSPSPNRCSTRPVPITIAQRTNSGRSMQHLLDDRRAERRTDERRPARRTPPRPARPGRRRSRRAATAAARRNGSHRCRDCRTPCCGSGCRSARSGTVASPGPAVPPPPTQTMSGPGRRSGRSGSRPTSLRTVACPSRRSAPRDERSIGGDRTLGR